MGTYSENREHDSRLIEEALAALQEKTGISAVPGGPEPAPTETYRPDGQVDFVIGGEMRHYVIECKAYIDRKIQVDQVRRQFESQPVDGILVTPYVSREIAEYCRSIDLQFLDTHGNAYLRGPGFFLYVTCEKSERGLKPVRAARGLTNSAAIRVAFALLCKPELVRSPYKEIAAAAQVSVGTASNTFDDLERRGYLINKGDSQRRRLLEPERLLDEWSMNYPVALRPKLHARRFSAPDPDWWANARLEGVDVAWGGEVAARELTRYLKPSTQTLYAAPSVMGECVKKLLTEYRLRPDPRGQVEILEKFWTPQLEQRHGFAPAVLVYAELLAMLDPRTTETAQMIKEKWIDTTFDKG